MVKLKGVGAWYVYMVYIDIYIYIHGIQGVFCGPPNMVPLGLQSSSSNI